jgi:putative nucleotidyltransferase with HDIG domain
MSVEEVLETENEDFSSRYDAQMSVIESLPSLPDLVWELQAAIQSSTSDSGEVAFIVEQDPSLAANILRLASSAAMGCGETFTSLADAVTRIGMNELECLANTVLIIETFEDYGNLLEHKTFWRHSIDVASAAEALADRFGPEITMMPKQAFIAGLLHDLGKLVVDQFFPEDFARVQKYAKEEHILDHLAERRILGMDHGEIFGRLIETWAFEPNILESVRYHHSVEECDGAYATDAELIRYADILCHFRQNSIILDDAPVHKDFPMTIEELAELMEELDDMANQRSGLLE